MIKIASLLAALTLLVASPALAGTYARVTNGQALDVVTGTTKDAALSGRFAQAFIDAQVPGWTTVPDNDTGGAPLQSGARSDGHGGFTNPAPAVPVMVPAALTKAAFQALLAQYGGDVAAALSNWPLVAQ